MASRIEEVMAKVQALSVEERIRLAGRILETVTPDASDRADRTMAYRDLRGKYKQALRPSEEFTRRKQDEIQIEDRSC